VVFPDAGHAYITDVAPAANQEVLRFLAGISRSRRRVRHRRVPGNQRGGHVSSVTDPLVRVRDGAVRGRAESGIWAFWGVPCTAPAFGANRMLAAATGWLGLLAVLQALLADESPAVGRQSGPTRREAVTEGDHD